MEWNQRKEDRMKEWQKNKNKERQKQKIKRKERKKQTNKEGKKENERRKEKEKKKKERKKERKTARRKKQRNKTNNKERKKTRTGEMTKKISLELPFRPKWVFGCSAVFPSGSARVVSCLGLTRYTFEGTGCVRPDTHPCCSGCGVRRGAWPASARPRRRQFRQSFFLRLHRDPGTIVDFPGFSLR